MPGQNTAPRLLVVMAHPDDAELLVGGTLFHLKALAWELGIVTMTAGDCGSAKHQKEEITRIRYQEAQAAADCLGAWYGCAGIMDIEVFLNEQNVRKVVELLRTFDPDVVVTHSPVDYMLDHEETSRLARAASFAMAAPLYQTRQAPPAKPARSTPALYYADPFGGTDPFGQRVYPHFYIDISEQLENKRRMLSCHASQRDWLREHQGVDEYLERMTDYAQLYGRESGVVYAEGLRQHLGHAYPEEAWLQDALKEFVSMRQQARE